ncbi:MAG: serine hydroxymethyltransferase [Lentisphaerae bacterium]|nr:serine hydroxymethyltransferase [Lentisphaerota bacterium]
MKEVLKQELAKAGVQAEDMGCYDKTSTDYPDYARAVALKVSQGIVDEGILICTTGIGMSIVANKFPRIRAALCMTPRMARLARNHNNANILVLGGELVDMDSAKAILAEWMKTNFSKVDRHARRVGKIQSYSCNTVDPLDVYEADPEIYSVISNETKRQQEHLELIASENYVSKAVREAAGSILTNKYAEGYPGKRWYDGCSFVDEAERLAIDRAKELFGAEHVNVQAHSGSSANMAVFMSVLEPGDTILAMDLKHGGHLTHGFGANFSGKLYNAVHYGVNPETEQIDYEQVEKLAKEHKPKMIIAGASAYSRIIDFKRFRKIADSVSAYFMADVAHLAGLIAAGCHPNPTPYADFVTSTTHKTLRGPRGGLIMCRDKFAEYIDKNIFPGLQGGPLMHIIAAKAVCFYEALQPGFTRYQEQIVKNAQALASAIGGYGYKIVSGGTDNHLMLVDVSKFNATGSEVSTALAKAGITVNKNMLPFDERKPSQTSGIRIGTPATTTRGMKEAEMVTIAGFINDVIENLHDDKTLKNIEKKVTELCSNFPVP